MNVRNSATSPWHRTRDREQERKLKREAVLRTAAQAFNEKGFHATSLDEVAERLRITKPTLYYYVKNKDEILFECLRLGLEALDQAGQEIERRQDSPLQKLVSLMRAYAASSMTDFGQCAVRVGEDPLPAAKRAIVHELKLRADRRFRGLIEAGIASGELAACDPKIATATIAGALSWIARWYRPGGSISSTDLVEGCIAMLMNGLSARTPTP